MCSLTWRSTARPPGEPGDRAGNPARHGAVPQPDRRSVDAAAHAGVGADSRRAWRQHGPDLVGRAGRRSSARAVPELERDGRRSDHQADPRQRCRGDQAEGGAGFAVGISIRDVVHSIALDQKRILPVPSLVNGPYGMRDVCISVPDGGRPQGCARPISRSSSGPRRSRRCSTRPVLRETIDAVYKSNPKAAAQGQRAATSRRACEAAANHRRRPRDDGAGGGNGLGGTRASRSPGKAKGKR